jgi:hypothetical protein
VFRGLSKAFDCDENNSEHANQFIAAQKRGITITDRTPSRRELRGYSRIVQSIVATLCFCASECIPRKSRFLIELESLSRERSKRCWRGTPSPRRGSTIAAPVAPVLKHALLHDLVEHNLERQFRGKFRRANRLHPAHSTSLPEPQNRFRSGSAGAPEAAASGFEESGCNSGIGRHRPP